jgi:hypothetical protein
VLEEIIEKRENMVSYVTAISSVYPQGFSCEKLSGAFGLINEPTWNFHVVEVQSFPNCNLVRKLIFFVASSEMMVQD